ncbi:MAG: hypothetical protein EBS64_04510 [Verrucomicrobia bacterium]|nr:hypothetical protein [Verrucomicrobiota bacterium]
MAGFDDSLVREYFEMNGFFVRQSRKYAVQSRRKRADEEGDLLVINPTPRRGTELPFQLFSSDLAGLTTAVVAVKAWHSTKTITPSMIKKGDLLEFVRKEAVEAARDAFADLIQDPHPTRHPRARTSTFRKYHPASGKRRGSRSDVPDHP